MGRKKRTVVALKPFCYYCDKEFNNEIILHQHQKARHFNCKLCRKRFSTAPALDTHMLQVHKSKLKGVPNAKATRDGFDISIYGMDGVPIELVNLKLAERVQAKKRKLIRENKMLADEEDLREEKMRKKKGYKGKEIDMKSLLKGGSVGFYHNPDSINLTLNKSQMNSIYAGGMMSMNTMGGPMGGPMVGPMRGPMGGILGQNFGGGMNVNPSNNFSNNFQNNNATDNSSMNFNISQMNPFTNNNPDFSK